MFSHRQNTKTHLVLFFLLAGMMFRSIEVLAQDARTTLVTLSVRDMPVKEVFKQLEKSTGLSINYHDNTLDVSRIVSIGVVNRPLSDVLGELLAGTHMQFTQNGTMILIVPVPPAPAKTPAAGGILKGRIVDFETSQPLPGATLTLLENGLTVLSDDRGYYMLKGVPEGRYDLTVSYAGYEKNYLSGIRVIAGKTQLVDVKMQAGKTLNEVVVKSGAHRIKSVAHSSDRQLLAEIRNATGVVSGISNEQIAKSADRNAAEIVKRISGVTVVDDRFIIVRGMNERYNLTYLNDNIAPSTELYSKAFAYDLLPSSVIDRILVYKSPVANLVADYAGAAIKVFTKNAMPVKHLDIGIQLAHRPGSTLTTVNGYKGGKYDFLGFDDGGRKLPPFPPSYLPGPSLSQASMLSAFSPNLDYGATHSLPDMQFFLNYYNVWNTGKISRLYNLTSVTYTHETKNYAVTHQTGNTYALGLGNDGYNYGQLAKLSQIQQTTDIGKINVLENLTWKWNPRNSIEWKNFFVNEGRSYTGITDSRSNVLPSVLLHDGGFQKRDIILSFQQRLLYSGNIGGSHQWGKRYPQELKWNLGYTYDWQNVPDQRGIHLGTCCGLSYYTSTGTNTGSYSDATLGMINRLFVTNKEQVYNVSLDYNIHIKGPFTLQAGAYQMYKVREVNRRFFRVNRGGLANGESGAIGNMPLGYQDGYGLSNENLTVFKESQLPTIWNPANFPDDNTGLKLYDVTSPKDSYVTSEQNNSFYVMGDWKMAHDRLVFNAGGRMEFDRQKSSSASANNGIIYPQYANHPITSWLPSANITWRPRGIFVLRAGAGRTVNRPEFREISAYQDFDFQNNEYIHGDPKIVSAIVDNYDLRAELYPKSLQQNEVVNVGAFYKYIKNPIERLRAELSSDAGGDNFTSITFWNAVEAKVYGLEAEIKKNLSFLGGRLFHDLSLSVNGAWIKSTTVRLYLDSAGNFTERGDGRPLQGQSPYVVNTGIFYENAGWGTRIGLIYNVSGPRIYAKSIASTREKDSHTAFYYKNYSPDIVQLPVKLLDLSVTQRIIKSLQMKFTIQNLLDQTTRLIEDHNYNQRYDPEYAVPAPPNPVTGIKKGDVYYKGDNIYNAYKTGRYFLVQFTYAF
ncbi:MAG: TonB-dependent receptor [Chitinophagaceae bacterium]|nr:TonB-dependent receptor [Chitinophagaceae bacterium]